MHCFPKLPQLSFGHNSVLWELNTEHDDIEHVMLVKTFLCKNISHAGMGNVNIESYKLEYRVDLILTFEHLKYQKYQNIKHLI